MTKHVVQFNVEGIGDVWVVVHSPCQRLRLTAFDALADAEYDRIRLAEFNKLTKA